MKREEIIDFCEMKSQLEPENEDIFNYIVKALEQETVPREHYEHEFFLRKELDFKVARLEKQIAEQEPCEDAVSRTAVLDILSHYAHNFGADNEIKALPPVTPTRKKGKWILLDDCSNSGYYCSECHKKVVKEGWSNTVKKIKFCPNCGAKMESDT